MISLLLLLIIPTRAFAAEITGVGQLIEQEDRLDKTQVVIQGEAIGEPMERGGECWVNVSSGGNAIGIKMKTSDARRIRMFGNYKQKGDVIRVTGTFYKACPEDGGETDIHSHSMEIVSRGSPTEHPMAPPRAAAALTLFLLTALGALVLRQKKLI